MKNNIYNIITFLVLLIYKNNNININLNIYYIYFKIIINYK